MMLLGNLSDKPSVSATTGSALVRANRQELVGNKAGGRNPSAFDFVLCADSDRICYLLIMPYGYTICPLICRSSYGCHGVDHLAANGTGLAAGQVAVVAFLQVDADLP